MTEKNIDKNESGSKRGEVIEIPVGRYVGAIKRNPWIISTVVFLAIALVLFFRGGAATGDVVSEQVAGQNLISFINAQGQGSASLTSVDKEGALYKVTVNYNGQDVPVYVSLDGKYLITDPVPLSSQGSSGANTNSNEKVNVEIGDAPMLGSKTAPVTIVEFSDYQCPFCRKFWTETYGQLKKDYIDTGKVKLVYKDFPLTDLHPQAEISAEAARCVREKGGDVAYFKYHDKMFGEQNKLDSGTVNGAVTKTVVYTADDLKKWAKDLGYDIGSCLDSGKYKDSIMSEEQYGQSLGITGTPGFFINGLRLDGAQPYSVFQQAIDAELNK